MLLLFLARLRRTSLTLSLTHHRPLRFMFQLTLIMKILDLREYAIFALRNILHNNPENQAVVNNFQTGEHVGPDVVVRELPGAK